MSEIQWLEEARQVSQLMLGARDRSAAELMAEASRTSGLKDFGAEPIEEPLAQLLEAYRRDGRLNGLGRLAVRWDNMRLLTNRLILRDLEQRDPAILQRRIEAPLFITGLPRSGTSFLHRLLALDPSALAVRSWQVVYPCPDHAAAGRKAGPERVQSELTLFGRIAPELMRIHPQNALAPQECGEITAHSFRSLRFDATYDAPSYRRWIRQGEQTDAYRVHRRFLQHLQGERTGRWVLKWPDHVFALAELHDAYPDARVIFSHRDPARALPSLARLTEVFRRPFVRGIDLATLGREVTASWIDGCQRILKACAEDLWPREQVAHVHFPMLVADPVGAVRRLYRQFGLPFTEPFEGAVRQFVSDHPKGGYGANAFDPTSFGMRPGQLRERLSGYVEAFDIGPEADA